MKKRLLYLGLFLCLITGAAVSAQAAEAVSYQDPSWNESENKVTYSEKTANNCELVAADNTAWSSGWYAAQGDITISGRVTVNGDVCLILMDGCTLTVDGGIGVDSGKSLTIYGQSEGYGTLAATASERNYAGIGGSNRTGGTITICGGKVFASAYYNAAGIGGGAASGGAVTIYGGTVTGTGANGAGIGGCNGLNGGVITIYGGTVTGTTNNGPGIGGNLANTKIAVYGGTVTATATGDYDNIRGNAKNFYGGVINGTPYHKVTFRWKLEEKPDDIKGVEHGQPTEALTFSGEPPEGKQFGGWSKDSAGTEDYDFNTPVTEDITLYAKWEENTDYVAEVTIDGNVTSYTNFATAWENVKNRTAALHILKDIEIGADLSVESGTDVTVTMEEGKTFTGGGEYCFYVDGGTLTINSGIFRNTNTTVTFPYVVYVNTGTVYITNGTFKFDSGKSNGTVLSCPSPSAATVALSGGTFDGGTSSNGAEGTAINYASSNILDLVDKTKQYAFYNKDGTAQDFSTTYGVVKGGPYTLKECDHSIATYTVNADNRDMHNVNCPACGWKKDSEPHTLDDNGVCTGCGETYSICALVTEEGKATEGYRSFQEAWDAVNGKTATLKLLESLEIKRPDISQLPADQLTNSTYLKFPRLTLPSGKVTLEMADGVKLSASLKPRDAPLLEISEGAALILNSGVIQCNGGPTIGVSGELTVNDGSILGLNLTGSTSAVVTVSSGGKLTVNGGLIDAVTQSDETYQSSNAPAVALLSAELTLRGGTIRNPQNSDFGCISTGKQDSSSSQPKVTISGGVVEGNKAISANSATAKISGGEIRGNQIGLLCFYSDIHLSGGVFHGGESIAFREGPSDNVFGFLADGYSYRRIDDNKSWLTDLENPKKIDGAVTIQRIPVKIDEEPAPSQDKLYGETIESLRIAASSISEENDLHYQWYRITPDTEMIPVGAGGAVFTPEERLSTGQYQYVCEVTCDGYPKRSDTVTLTINPRELEPRVAQSGIGKVYDGTVNVPESQITLEGVLDGDEVTASAVFQYDSPDAGEDKTITVSGVTLGGAAKDNYTLKTDSFTTTGRIDKAEGVITAVPEARTLTYSGEPQTLVSPGAANGGTLVYSIEEAGPYSEEPPILTNAGAYEIWYKLEGGLNYTDTAPASVTARIDPKEVLNPTIEVTPNSFDYDGGEKKPSVVVKDGDTVIPAAEYTVEYRNNVNEGTAEVLVNSKEGGNYDFSGKGSFSITRPAVDSPVGASVEIKKIEKDGEQLVITLDGELKTGGKLIAAFYHANGRFLSVRILDAATEARVTPPDGAGTIKAMLLNSVWRPLCQEKTLTSG